MSQRLDYAKASPDGYRAVAQLNRYTANSGLEHSLLELVKIRASLLNGCAYCLDMHTKDAASAGESEQRLYGVAVWREAPFYTGRERAALAFTEAVTLIGQHQVPDELYEEARAHFSEKELVDLTLAIIVINAWNRLAITFRTPPGSYEPDHPVTQRRPVAEHSGART